MSLRNKTAGILIFMAVIEFILCSTLPEQRKLSFSRRISQKKAERKNRIEKINERSLPASCNPDCDAEPVEINSLASVTYVVSGDKCKNASRAHMNILEMDNIENTELTFDTLFELTLDISFSRYRFAINDFLKQAKKWRDDLRKELKAQIKTFQQLELQCISSKFDVAIKDEQLSEHNEAHTESEHQCSAADKEKLDAIYSKYEILFSREGKKVSEMTIIPIMSLFIVNHLFCLEYVKQEIVRINSYRSDINITPRNISNMLYDSKVSNLRLVDDINTEIFTSALKERYKQHTTADILKLVMYYYEALTCIRNYINYSIFIISEALNKFKNNGKNGSELSSDPCFESLFDKNDKGKFNLGALESFYRDNDNSLFMKDIDIYVEKLWSALNTLSLMVDASKENKTTNTNDPSKQEGSEKSGSKN